MTDFRNEKPDKAKRDDIGGSMTMVGEIVANARSNGHILRSMIPISPMARTLDVMVTRRERQRLPKEVVATYVVGRMAMRGDLS